MQRIINIYRLGIKELRSLWHDKVLLFFVIWVFSGGIYSVATGTSLELHNAPIAIVDEDRSPLSERIINAFYGPYFKTPERITVAAIDPGMDSGQYTFVIDIPPDFQRDVLAGRQPEIQVNIDATRMSQAFIGDGYIENIVSGEINEFIRGYRADTKLPIQLAVRVKFNPNLTSTWFGSVMELINNVTMLGIILTGAALIREREHGTLEHLLVMPLTPFEIMTAKVWANGLVVLSAAALSLILVVQGLLQVPIAGSVPLFLIGTALHLFSTHLHGGLFWHPCALDAPTGPDDDSGHFTPADALRRQHTLREHAKDRAGHHAGGAHHPLRQFRPGDPLSWRRLRHGMAAFCGCYRHRRGILSHRSDAFPQKYCRVALTSLPGPCRFFS